MANYKIANEQEAATIGGGASYTSNLAVTKIRAISLGCTIRLESYTDNQLVALKDLQKIESQSCTCNSGVCNCNGYNAGCSGECSSVNSSCSCNSSQCSCYGYQYGCSDCWSDSECGCNSGVCSCNGYVAGCSGECSSKSSCDCNSTVCSCHKDTCSCVSVCTSQKYECYDGCSDGWSCSIFAGCGYAVCSSDYLNCSGYDCACYRQCDSNCASDSYTCTSKSEYCTGNCWIHNSCSGDSTCSCNGYSKGCSEECYSDSLCYCNTGYCACDVYESCSCDNGKCYSHNDCKSKSTCSCNQKNTGCSSECHTQNSCSCNTVCTNDCSVNYG